MIGKVGVGNKIEGLLFDLDGILIDACEWHYLSLNEALVNLGYRPIEHQDHMENFNGLPTKVKLDILITRGHILSEEAVKLWQIKQSNTLRIIRENSKPDNDKIWMLSNFRRHGYKIGCVTNSIRETATAMLEGTGLMEHLDLLITNQDITHPKPNPEGYLVAMQKLGLDPRHTVIFEDSPKGLEAAEKSGAHVAKMSFRTTTYYLVAKKIREFIDDWKNYNSTHSNGGGR